MNKKAIIAFLLLLLIGGAITGCFLFKRKPKEETKPVDREHAELILKNLAVGMRLYSAKTGGGGETQFTGDMAKLQGYVMRDAFAACGGNKPYRGFNVELIEYPPGDDFKTNFRFVARPAPGFTGDSYAIDKTEKIVFLNNQE